MTLLADGQPAIALVDDDYHSARLMTRMLDAHGAPAVTLLNEPEGALESLAAVTPQPEPAARLMAVVDLKASSGATREFVARLKQRAPGLLVVAMAPSLDRETRGQLIEAGAAAVFQRHADIDLYRREAASIVSFWVRSQRLDAVGA